MFGIIVGTGLVIIGTAAVIRHHRCGHRAMLGCALKRLKANEEQKERLTQTFEEARTRLDGTRQRVHGLRGELIDVLTAPTLDGQRLETLEARLFETMGEATLVMRESVARVHETLDPQQRKQLADWIRRAGRHHHHHCHAAACGC